MTTTPLLTSIPDACIRCRRGLFSRCAEERASAEQLAEWRGQGKVRYHGRGVCSSCYRYLKAHGGLDEYPIRRWTPGGPITTCTRCGIKTTALDRLCEDCTEVAGDLHETELWVAS